jgi:HlyD family secretion protein
VTPKIPSFGLFILLAACSHRESDDQTAAAARSPRAVSVGRVTREDVAPGVTLSGVLVPREEAAVSSQITGYPVTRVFVDQDAQVAAGQPLAQLDDTLLRTDIAQQRAVLDQQRVAAEKASQEAARVTGIAETGVLSQEAIAERKLGARAAAASVDQAKAQLNALLVRQRLMTVRAPVAGRILQRNVRPGDIASNSGVMFTISRDDLVELDAEVPEQTIDALHAGQEASVTLASGTVVRGVVRLVSAQIDDQTKLGRARILMAARPDLRPGGFATATLATAAHPQTVVPQEALRYDASGAHLMVVDAKNRVHGMIVQTGPRSGDKIALVGGPTVGTPVLTGGQSFVLDGDQISPVEAR